MDLFCPHCTRRVTVPDEKAGLILNCPLCGKQFMAPALPPPMTPPPKPVPAPAPPLNFGPGASAPAPISPAPSPAAPPAPPPPPGDYTRMIRFHLRGTWLAFVPLACLLLIFILSFFTWKQPEIKPPAHMWALAFSSDYNYELMPYVLLSFVAGILVVASLVFEKQLVPIPPGLKAVLVWKDLVIALFLALCYLLLVAAYIPPWFNDRYNPIRPAMDFAVRVQLLAAVASLLLFWANWRRFRNSPPVECNVRW